MGHQVPTLQGLRLANILLFKVSNMSVDLTVLDNRLIAFLDVLGFANRMDNESAVSIVKEYGKFIADADKAVFNPQNMLSNDVGNISNFATSKFVFDSIVLVSHPIDDSRNICNFIFAIILLMEKGFLNNLPLRGAISLGSYVEDRTNGVFVSPEFKSLHFEEQRLQWAGCCVLDNAADTVLKGLHGRVISPELAQRHYPVIYYSVPIKDKDNSISEIPRWALNWTYFLSSSQLSSTIDYLIEPKKSETAKFAEYVANLSGAYRQLVEGHQPPIYLRFMPSIFACRLKFTDESDNPSKPQSEISIAFDAKL